MDTERTSIEISMGDLTMAYHLMGEWERLNKVDPSIIVQGMGKLDTKIIRGVPKGFLKVLETEGITYKEV
jgi:hypothetical protein